MKKFLLFAVAALTAATMSAQLLTKQQSDLRPASAQSASRVNKSQVRKLDLSEVHAVANSGKPVVAGRDMRTLSKKVALRPFSGIANIAPSKVSLRKAASQALDEYSAKGTVVDLQNQTYGGTESWTMYGGSDSEGGLYLGDMLPNDFGSEDHIWAQYEIVEDYLVVEPQPIADLQLSVGEVTVWLCAFTDAEEPDGKIILNIDDEGGLTPMSDSEWYCYMVFNKDAEFDPTFQSEDYLGYWAIMEGTTYSAPGAPVASIYPEGLYLHAGLGYNGYGFGSNYAMIPAYAPINFLNYSTEGNVYAWSVNALEYDTEASEYVVDETFEGNEENFTYETVGGSTYDAVTLNISNSVGESTYAWGSQFQGKNHYAYAGEFAEDFAFSDGVMPVLGVANPDFDIAYHPGLATPGVNAGNFVMSELVLYQGKPTAPLYCEGINMLIRDFVDNGDFTLTCGIYKAQRNAAGKVALGELIAESSTVEVFHDNLYEFRFTDFYVYDEDGMTEGIDYLFIEDECAIVISGWDNGTFDATPYVEYNQNENGPSYTFFKLNMDGYDNEALFGFTGSYEKVYAGFYNAAYGYLHTEDNTDLTFYANGGEASIHVVPMLFNGKDAENGQTRIFLENEEDVPEWLGVSVANEEYNEENFCFDLVVTADPMPEGETVRSAEFSVFQEGAKLTISVTQSMEDGIASANAAVVRNGKTYNLAGQQVAKTQKGVVLAGGKKMLNK